MMGAFPWRSVVTVEVYIKSAAPRYAGIIATLRAKPVALGLLAILDTVVVTAG